MQSESYFILILTLNSHNINFLSLKNVFIKVVCIREIKKNLPLRYFITDYVL